MTLSHPIPSIRSIEDLNMARYSIDTHKRLSNQLRAELSGIAENDRRDAVMHWIRYHDDCAEAIERACNALWVSQ